MHILIINTKESLFNSHFPQQSSLIPVNILIRMTSVHLCHLWPNPTESICGFSDQYYASTASPHFLPPNPTPRWIWCVTAPSGIARRQIYHGIDTWSSSEQWTTSFCIFPSFKQNVFFFWVEPPLKWTHKPNPPLQKKSTMPFQWWHGIWNFYLFLCVHLPQKISWFIMCVVGF